MKRISIQWDLNPRPQEFSFAGLCSTAVLQPHSVEKIKDSTLKNFEGKNTEKSIFSAKLWLICNDISSTGKFDVKEREEKMFVKEINRFRQKTGFRGRAGGGDTGGKNSSIFAAQ